MEDSITEIRVLSDQEGGKPGYTPKKMFTGLAVGSYKSRKEKKCASWSTRYRDRRHRRNSTEKLAGPLLTEPERSAGLPETARDRGGQRAGEFLQVRLQ